LSIFKRKTISLAEHERIVRMNDADASDQITSLYQQVGELKSQVAAMQKPTTDEGLNEISAAVALHVDNLFVRAWDSPAKRTRAVQITVREAIRESLTGSTHWNPPSV